MSNIPILSAPRKPQENNYEANLFMMSTTSLECFRKNGPKPTEVSRISPTSSQLLFLKMLVGIPQLF